MAKLISPFTFIGPLSGVSAYTMRGVDHVVVRMKGGASRNRIKTDPVFALTRMNNAEFGGRATASKYIVRAIHPLKHLADYPITGSINALLKPVQILDTVRPKGERFVELSRMPHLLAGFSLNRKHPFDSVVRTAIPFIFSRNNPSAVLQIPPLLTGINLFAPYSFSHYRMIATVGIVPDLFFTQERNRYKPRPEYELFRLPTKATESDWFELPKGSPATTLTTTLPEPVAQEGVTVIIGIGISFGRPLDGQIQPVRHAGCAKVLAVA